MSKLLKSFAERRVFKKRNAQILQTSTGFRNECEATIKEREKHETAI